MQRISETLELRGCLTRMKGNQGQLELLASHGLSDCFLMDRPAKPLDAVCFQTSERVKCFSDIRSLDSLDDYEAMMIEGIRALAVIPVEINQNSIGLTALFADKPRKFDKTELSFAASLVTEGLLAIHWKTELDSAMERERRFLSGFQEISGVIHSTLTIKEVLQLITKKVTQILEAKGCTVRLLDVRTQELYLAQSYGLSEQFLSKGPIDAQKSIAENMAGKVVVIEDVFTDNRLQYPDETAREGIRKMLSIPLSVQDRVIGVLRVVSGERPPFSEQEIQFAVSIAGQCALAIENAHSYQRAQHNYQNLMTELGYMGSS